MQVFSTLIEIISIRIAPAIQYGPIEAPLYLIFRGQLTRHHVKHPYILLHQLSEDGLYVLAELD